MSKENNDFVYSEVVEDIETVVEDTTEPIVEEVSTEEAPVIDEPIVEEVVVPEVVIALEEKVVDEVPNLGATVENVISSGKTPKKSKKTEEAPKKIELEKVAIYSSRTVNWQGVGEVKRGYNLVTPEQAAKWLTRIHTRLVQPEEIAKEFGN
jgi:hypothetical protein